MAPTPPPPPRVVSHRQGVTVSPPRGAWTRRCLDTGGGGGGDVSDVIPRKLGLLLIGTNAYITLVAIDVGPGPAIRPPAHHRPMGPTPWSRTLWAQAGRCPPLLGAPLVPRCPRHCHQTLPSAVASNTHHTPPQCLPPATHGLLSFSFSTPVARLNLYCPSHLIHRSNP